MKELWLCTRQYPTGQGELFLQHAIPVWAKQFDKIVIIPMYTGPGELTVHPGAEVVRLWQSTEFTPLSAGRSVWRAPDVYRAMRRHGKKDGHSQRSILSHSRQLLHKADVFHKVMMGRYDSIEVSVLSIWMEDWLSVLGTVKDRAPQFRFAAMGHGWDLFEHRRATGNIPYRDFQLAATDQLLVVSRAGLEHIANVHPAHLEKVSTTYLGTPDHGMAPWAPSEILRLVSCSYLRKPKRVDLLIKALSLIEVPVHWTHFGDGPDREVLEQLIASLPSHITVDMKGTLPNHAVLDWYKRTPVDLFVHISESEGLPLVLMEAASFGIPLLANDVGGVKEIVGNGTGKLLNAVPTSEQLATGIIALYEVLSRTNDLRADARAFWLKNFDRDKNYGSIGQLLQGSNMLHGSS